MKISEELKKLDPKTLKRGWVAAISSAQQTLDFDDCFASVIASLEKAEKQF